MIRLTLGKCSDQPPTDQPIHLPQAGTRAHRRGLERHSVQLPEGLSLGLSISLLEEVGGNDAPSLSVVRDFGTDCGVI